MVHLTKNKNNFEEDPIKHSSEITVDFEGQKAKNTLKSPFVTAINSHHQCSQTEVRKKSEFHFSGVNVCYMKAEG